MIIKIAYSQGKGELLEETIARGILQLIKDTQSDDYPKVGIESYDEEHHREKKDAYMLKASCGARLLPFCAVYDDDKNLVKAFYSEVGECTSKNILDYVKSEIF